MTKEQSRKHIEAKIVAAMLALLVLSVGIGMHAVYADDDGKDKDSGESNCTTLLGLPIICSDSTNIGVNEATR